VGEALSEVQIKWPRRPCARGLAGGASVPCAPAALDMQSREAQRRERARELLKRREVSPRM
jgi:hypothetical protein